MQDHICKTCKKTFKSKERDALFCSRKCANARNSGDHVWKCMQCGKTFHKAASRIPNKNKIFCSRSCSGQWKTENLGVFGTCETCGKTFRRCRSYYERHGGKYCSQECFGKAKQTARYNKEATEINTWRQSLGWKEFSKTWLRMHPVCDACGVKKEGRNLCIHHKTDPNKRKDAALLFSPSNLIVICRSCHLKIHASLRR